MPGEDPRIPAEKRKGTNSDNIGVQLLFKEFKLASPGGTQ